MSQENGKLSGKGHWDALYGAVSLPRSLDFSQHHYRACDSFFATYFEPQRGGSLLEAGCGASAWLPRFAGRYGMSVSGLDYSEEGCRLAAENLRLHGFKPEGIFCADIYNFKPPRLYDAVFSYGLVEHFRDYEAVLARMAGWLAPGGVLLTLVPNLRGLSGLMSRLAVPDIFDMHVSLGRAALARANEAAGLELLSCRYAGVFSLAVVPWSRSGLFSSAPVLRALNYSNAALSKLCNVVGGPSTALLSPYLVSAARRKK